jgi:hypothetical protein
MNVQTRLELECAQYARTGVAEIRRARDSDRRARDADLKAAAARWAEDARRFDQAANEVGGWN